MYGASPVVLVVKFSPTNTRNIRDRHYKGTNDKILGFPGGTSGKEPACQCSRLKRCGFNGQEDPLEKGMSTHSSILAWRIPWTEKPGGLQSMGSQRVGHD